MPVAFEERALRSRVADNSADFVPVANDPIPVIAGLDRQSILFARFFLKFDGCPDQVRA